ncbi:hypothetical protein [Alicyclobacillus mengziensis]|uniref:Uncharacterized protein n=1 Tax=Alicyclobacillus mengziensis TaxID=2931921 RepID=A0A9X7W0H1_9BACL|nr:hypothetical protein [Alicyclobacillus mengziensis]QSO48493.1 hypothetical protein JZ786_05760 [Alicyclobacillus mengziensis]
MDNDTKKMIEGYLRSYDADQLINEILEVLEKEEREDSEDFESEAVFSHNISSFHIDRLDSQLSKAKQKKTLGNHLKKLATDRGIYQYSSKVFGEAQITDKYWNKLLNDNYPNPRKDPLLRIAIALKLNLLEGMRLLRRAGMTLSGNNMKDAVVAYCLDAGIYDFADIEEVLAEKGIQTLFTNQREITKRKEKSKEKKAKKAN